MPRYGATSNALPKPPALASPLRDKAKVSILDESAGESVRGQSGREEGLPREKNIWKSWRFLLSQLSSPDGVPPPVTNTERGRSTEQAVTRMNALEDSNRRQSQGDARQQSSPAGSIHSKMSTWSVRSNPTKTLSRRSKSTFGTRKLARSHDSQVPPIPPPAPSAHGERTRNDSTDLDSDRDASTNWGTDVSLESSLSTAPSSFAGHSRMRTGSQSSKISHVTPAAANGASGLPSGQWQSQPQLARPSVTSEVLMPDHAAVMRISPGKHAPSSSLPSLSQSWSTAPVQTFQQLRIDSATPPRRSLAPSDVPEDARPDDEEIANLSPPSRGPDTFPLSSSSASNRPSSSRSAAIRPGSSDSVASSRPGSSSSRRTKRLPPPVVSAYQATSWDSAYVKSDGQDSVLSSDSDRTVRPGQRFIPAPTPVQVARAHQRTYSNHLQSSIDGFTSTYDVAAPRGSYEPVSRSHPLPAEPTRSTSTATTRNGNAAYPDYHRTPTSSNAGQASNAWVLQSLHSTNGSHKGGSPGGTVTPNGSPVVRSSSEETRARMIPKKAPPPMYAPPQPPSKSSQSSSTSRRSSSPYGSDQERGPAAAFTGLTVSHSHSSVSSSLDGHGPHNGFLATSQSGSRRPSISDSIRSVGTFG